MEDKPQTAATSRRPDGSARTYGLREFNIITGEKTSYFPTSARPKMETNLLDRPSISRNSRKSNGANILLSQNQKPFETMINDIQRNKPFDRLIPSVTTWSLKTMSQPNIKPPPPPVQHEDQQRLPYLLPKQNNEPPNTKAQPSESKINFSKTNFDFINFVKKTDEVILAVKEPKAFNKTRSLAKYVDYARLTSPNNNMDYLNILQNNPSSFRRTKGLCSTHSNNGKSYNIKPFPHFKC